MTPAEAIWARAGSVRAAMLAMPFNRGLSYGTLPRETFKHYMQQDAAYLVGYARALAIGAAKAPTPEDVLHFSDAAKTAIVVEQALHSGYLAQFGVAAEEVGLAEPSPTTAGYVNFLLAEAATGSFATLTAAVLPCFWVYREVGLAIATESRPGNFYQAWIDTYADESFGAATARMISVYNRAFAAAGPAEQTRMEAAFLRCCQYEWMFWDAAWRREAWPIST